MNKISRNMVGLAAGCAFFMMSSVASASILGTGSLNLSVANCSGGGATVTATTIVWSPAGTAANTGCIDTGLGTGINFTAGSLGPNDIGNIMDLTAGTIPVNDFMTFSGTPLDFVLTGIGPGSSNTNCALSAANPTCSVAAGSPFILTFISSTATAVGLGVSGTLNDGTGGTSAIWNGSFTTQLNESGSQIQSTELTGGAIASTQSGNFAVTVASTGTPEPSSMVMVLMGAGLIAIALRRRTRIQ